MLFKSFLSDILTQNQFNYIMQPYNIRQLNCSQTFNSFLNPSLPQIQSLEEIIQNNPKFLLLPEQANKFLKVRYKKSRCSTPEEEAESKKWEREQEKGQEEDKKMNQEEKERVREDCYGPRRGEERERIRENETPSRKLNHRKILAEKRHAQGSSGLNCIIL